MSIGIVGAGSWGTTLASLFSTNNIVNLYVRNVEHATSIQKNKENVKYLPGFKLNNKINVTNNPKDLNDCEFVVFAVPSIYFREVMKDFSFLNPSIPFISVTKGPEQASHMRMSQVILDMQNKRKQDSIAVLSGPNLAIEIMENKPAATVIASTNESLAKKIQVSLVSKNFRVYTSNDVIGSEISGIAKNIIAIAVGIGDGAGYGDNAKALVITRGLAEMQRLGIAAGGKPETFAGLAGIGDLIATCSSDLSRNRRVGIQLGQGKTLAEILSTTNQVAEGVNSARSLSEYAKSLNVSMPITDSVCRVIEDGEVTKDAVAQLMTRPPTSE